MTGTVFDIKEFSLHDGPGPRVTVFLKGCPLRCRWCHNPEGLSPKPQLMVKQNLCTKCGKCFQSCDHPECAGLGRCLYACPNGLVSLSGQVYEAEELAKKVMKNADFYAMNGGGVTVSGGEPLAQADFVCALFDYLPIHKAIQTSGYADNSVFKRVIDRCDYVMMDVKLADREMHKQYTGVYNDKILENLEYLKQSGKAYVIRTPLIPNITDTQENLAAIQALLGDSPWEKLPYNTMAGAKYPMLGMQYGMEQEKA